MVTFKQYITILARGGSTVVKQLTHHPNVKGLCPDTVAGISGQSHKELRT